MIKNFLIALVTLMCAVLAHSQSPMGDDLGEFIESINQKDNQKEIMADFIQQKNRKLSDTAAEKISETVIEQAKHLGVDASLLLGIIWKESRYTTNAKSSGGAKGLMQVIPYWHKDKIKGRNIFDIPTNIEVGSKIISQCLNLKNNNMTRALACYSGNTPKTVSKYKAQVFTHKTEYEKFYQASEQMAKHNNSYAVMAWQSLSADNR